MAKIRQVEHDAVYLRLLLYGAPGSGKTRTACSAALDERTAPALYLNSGGNPVSIRDYAQKPFIIDLETLGDLNAPFDWLATGQPADHAFPNSIGWDGVKFKTLIIDGVTDIQRMSFHTALGQTGKGPGDFFSKREWDHYYAVLHQTQNMAHLFYNLPMHVIMTALEKNKEDRVLGRQMYQPLLDGQADQELPGKAEIVGRMVHTARLSLAQKKDAKKESINPDDYGMAAYFKPTNQFHAKDQTGRLGTFIMDPTISKMMDKIMAGTNPTQNPK